jgi:hypothetical protein
VTPTSLLNPEPVYGYDYNELDDLAQARALKRKTA